MPCSTRRGRGAIGQNVKCNQCNHATSIRSSFESKLSADGHHYETKSFAVNVQDSYFPSAQAQLMGSAIFEPCPRASSARAGHPRARRKVGLLSANLDR